MGSHSKGCRDNDQKVDVESKIRVSALKMSSLIVPRVHSTNLLSALQGLRNNSADSVTITESVSVSGATRLATRLKGSTVLRQLVVNCCNLTDEHVELLSDGLKRSVLRTVYLGYNFVHAPGVQALMQAALVTNTLETLSLYGNEIGDEGAAIIGEYLPRLTLVTLDLGKNGIKDEGGFALASGLLKSRLKDLFLACNELSDTSGVQIAKSIRENARLESIDLQENAKISDTTAIQIFSSIRTHGSIRNVTLLPGANISSEVNRAIHGRLALLHSKKIRLMVVLCSAKFVPRIGKESPCRWLPPDLIRAICDAITFSDH